MMRWDRVHHHTLAGMCQIMGGDLDYSTLLRVTRRVTGNEREVWRAFQRAVFNVLASNRDDHGKNHGFLYLDGQWSVGPAYDLTFSNASVLPERGMIVLGERMRVDEKDLVRLAANEALEWRKAGEIIDETHRALSQWDDIAASVAVPEHRTIEIKRLLRAV
ncbi:hypothetical protein AW736_05905 [Termitidicoccus mucosus]|uniref:HipA-like C-terminal domain-containing protein n=1 Tax=Termitidicoccus mucosus TaxID=1184151 RepID=A0A178IM40_9BACT|nr:hypothetical protein AW736_05905 [Opitutaceae bacterium TSB47]